MILAGRGTQNLRAIRVPAKAPRKKTFNVTVELSDGTELFVVPCVEAQSRFMAEKSVMAILSFTAEPDDAAYSQANEMIQTAESRAKFERLRDERLTQLEIDSLKHEHAGDDGAEDRSAKDDPKPHTKASTRKNKKKR